MKTYRLITLLAAIAGAPGCASLQSVSMTNIPAERGHRVEATADNMAFLGIHFDNDFADDVPDELRAQCPHGKVTGIYSKYESKWYVVVENRSVTVTGYCVAPVAQNTPAPVKATPVPAAPSVPASPAAPPAAAPGPTELPPAPAPPPAAGASKPAALAKERSS
jgi:hypothetical protein